MRTLAEPLLLPFLCFAAGLIAPWYLNGFNPAESFCAMAAVLALTFFARRGKHRVAMLGGWAVAAALTGTAISEARMPGAPPTLSVPDNIPAVLEGCVTDPAMVAADREKFEVELSPGAKAEVSLFAKASQDFPALPYGTRVEFTGKVRTPHNFNNPGAFDAVHFLARKNVFWNVSADAATVRTLSGRCGNGFARFLFAIRSGALERLDRLYADDPYSNGMMQAVLVGATAKLDRMWTDDYRSTGTFHALVISGSHVALLAGILLFFLRICAAPRGLALALTIATAWLYAGITGWQAPVLRSAAGMTLYGIGSIFFREGRLLNILAGVALLFVITDPEQIFEASFQLSFLAVALIGAFVVPVLNATSGPLTRALPQLSYAGKDIRLEPRSAQFRLELRLLAATVHHALRLPQRVSLFLVTASARACLFFWEIFVTSLFIQIGLALPLIVYFHRLSTSGLSANALVVPLLSAVVPLGFLAIALQSHAVAQLCAGLLSVSRAAVSWHARWEPDWRIPSPPLWLATLFVLLLVFAAWRMRRGARPLAAWSLAAACLGTIAIHPFTPAVVPGQFQLSVIDVGQGDSLLAAFPDGRLMLIDAGGIPSFGRSRKSSLDIGESVVSPYLWSRSIRHLDVVAMTHAHEDHVGGMSSVLRNFHPRELWTGAVMKSPEWDRVRETASQLGIRIREMKRSPPFAYGGTTVAILAPDAEYQPRDKPSNDDSLVMRIVYGRNSFLLTGDMEKRIEEQLFYEGALTRTDVLKIGHHGSRTSTTSDLLDAVKPVFGVISDGFENSYGHPHPLTLRALEDHHVAVFRTDQLGLVSISSDGRRLFISN